MKLPFQIRLSRPQIILAGFAALILIGSLLLMLPVSSADHSVTPFINTLFTATSAGCVTGLVVYDTATHWSLFGKLILITLIQIGGLGVVTMTTLFTRLAGKRIGLNARSTMRDAISAPHIGGIVQMTTFIVKMTFLFETIGAVAMMPIFIRDFGPVRGIGASFFHSISAFCNAGFDLMGRRAPFSSLTAYQADPLINITIILLILTGGIGFLTWDDMRHYKLKFHKYSTQSKLILASSVFLIAVPAVIFWFTEFKDLPAGERFLTSLFHAVTPRTAGFNTADFNRFSDNGIALTILLMLVGGAPGSTAGGMKITTVAILFISMVSVFRQDKETVVFRRRIPGEVFRNASAIFFLDGTLFLLGGMLISQAEHVSLRAAFFESASAVATVGLTVGITPGLHTFSKILLVLMMYLGRVGGLTLIFAAVSPKNNGNARYPEDRMTVG